MTIAVKNQIGEIQKTAKIVSDFCLEHSLSAQVESDLNLALDEVLANVILHGFNDSGEHEIIVRLCVEPGLVSLTVEDEGVPFNPLDAPTPDLTLPIEQRPIGGLGIHLVRNVMDELDYQRKEGRNCLFMKKRVELGKK